MVVPIKYRNKLDTTVIGSICFNCAVFEFGGNVFDIEIRNYII